MVVRLFCFAVTICVLGGSIPAQAESLRDAVDLAIQEHPTVEAALTRIDIAKQQKREVFSNYFPELSLNAQSGRMFGDNATSRGLVTTRGEAYSYFAEGSVNLRQRIFDGLETPYRNDAARFRIQSARANAFDIQEQLGLVAVQAYINLKRARAGLAVIEEHLNQVRDYSSRIRTMVNEGAADESELRQSEDILVIIQGIQSEFQGQVNVAEAQFMEVTGQDAPAHLASIPDLETILPESAKNAVEYSLQNHPALYAADMDREAAKYDAKAQSAVLFPDLDGELSYLKSDKKDEIGGEVEDARALLKMNWSFSTGGAELAQIQQAKLTQKETEALREELRRQIERDITIGYSELETAGEQLHLLQHRLNLNTSLFKANKSQFEGARINLLQLMQSHNQLFNTELETINGRHRYYLAQYNVLASMGDLQNALFRRIQAE